MEENMYKKGTESWRIVTGSDLSLNFTIFTGCIYGLIDDVNGISNNRLWPPKYLMNKLDKSSMILLKGQWNKWFNDVIEDRGKKVILKQSFDLTTDMFNPPDFSEFPYCELRECCKNAWQPFIEWWQMTGGGRNALSYFERLDNEKIYEYISEFENISQRKVKPFNLYIDMIYTYTSEIVEVNSEYIIIVPDRSLYFNKDWWMNKLRQIG
jgi:hypothetical protein